MEPIYEGGSLLRSVHGNYSESDNAVIFKVRGKAIGAQGAGAWLDAGTRRISCHMTIQFPGTSVQPNDCLAVLSGSDKDSASRCSFCPLQF